jgi:hypothetical protein
MPEKDYSETVTENKLSDEREEEFRKFKKRLNWIIITGLIAGTILTVLGEKYGKAPIAYLESISSVLASFVMHAILVLKEIGMGLIVSAIAVFGYERLNRLHDEFKRRKLEEGTFKSLDEAVKALTSGMHPPEEVYKSALQQLLPKELRIREMIERFTNDVIAIGNQKTVYREQHLAFVAWLLEKTLVEITHSLADLHNGIMRRSEYYVWNHTNLDSSLVAPHILTYTMESIQVSGGSYDSISNVLFWEGDRMLTFFDETEKCLQRGLRIRRVFNVTNFDRDQQLRTAKFKIAKDIVQRHLELQKKYKNYSIRFFGEKIHTDGLISVKLTLPATLQFLTDKFPAITYGMFRHSPGNLVTVCNIVGDRLENMFMTICGESSPLVGLFEEIWKHAEGARNPFAGNVYDAGWLDQHCKRLKKNLGKK